MILKISLKKNKKKNICIIVTKKHKILEIIGLIKNNNLYLNFKKFKYYLLLGSNISLTVKNLLYKKLKKKLLLNI